MYKAIETATGRSVAVKFQEDGYDENGQPMTNALNEISLWMYVRMTELITVAIPSCIATMLTFVPCVGP